MVALESVVVGAVVGVVSVVVVQPAVARSRARTLAAQSRVECALRVTDGDVPGLRRRWRHGRADIAPGGALVLQPYLLGMRPFPQKPVTVGLVGIVDAVPRQPGPGDLLSISWHVRTVTLAAPTGTVQVAMLPELIPWALAVLGSPVAGHGVAPVGAAPVSGPLVPPGGAAPAAPGPAASDPPPTTPEGFVPPT